MRANAWTAEEDGVLRAHSYEGAGGVQDALVRELGVFRTLRAIEQRAHLIRASLKRLDVCPECGAVGVRINRQSGMCARCTEEGHVAEERAFRDLLALEAVGCDEGPEIEAARREYARLRQANSRMCRKHGLRTKRQREG